MWPAGHSTDTIFVRDYDLHRTNSKPIAIPIGQAAAKHVRDSRSGRSEDTTPIDDVEMVAKNIPVPQKSPKPLDPTVVRLLHVLHFCVLMELTLSIRAKDVRTGQERLSWSSCARAFSLLVQSTSSTKQERSITQSRARV